jgi:hypothetical protein
VQRLDPKSFVDRVTFLAAASVGIYFPFLLIIPVYPELRRLRLALAIGNGLRKALADEKHLQPRASLYYDRLSQFLNWQRNRPITLARTNLIKRLSNMGNLSLAVRRAWRALDSAKPYIDPAIDARARRILPTLSPEETLDLAQTYLTEALALARPESVDLVHAGAALYGAAVLTTSEARLLARLKLVRRII